MALGLKVPPALLDHVPPVAEPPTEPPSAAEVPPWQMAAKAEPALAVGNGLTVIVPVAETVPHPPVNVTV